MVAGLLRPTSRELLVVIIEGSITVYLYIVEHSKLGLYVSIHKTWINDRGAVLQVGMEKNEKFSLASNFARPPPKY